MVLLSHDGGSYFTRHDNLKLLIKFTCIEWMHNFCCINTPTQIQVTYHPFHNDLAELQKHVPEVTWSKTSYKPQVDLSS